MFAPLVRLDAGLDTNTTVRAISSGVPIRPVGLSAIAIENRSGTFCSMLAHTPPSK